MNRKTFLARLSDTLYWAWGTVDSPVITTSMQSEFFYTTAPKGTIPGSEATNRNEYQEYIQAVKLMGEDGRCLELTIYHLHVPIL